MKIRVMLAAIAICSTLVVTGCRTTSRRYVTPVVTSPSCCTGQTAAAAPAPAAAPLPPPPH